MAKHTWERPLTENEELHCQCCGWVKFPPILKVLRDGAGKRVLCPNCTAILIAGGELSFENDLGLTDDITGKPGAVEYVSGDERYALERHTMKRLLAHNLTKEEWLALSRKYGADQYMLHEDFYAEDGTALQPVVPLSYAEFYRFGQPNKKARG